MTVPPQGFGIKVFFVSILASPSSGQFPLAVSFSETIIGGTGPFTFSWTFGDGGTSTAATPNHVYTYNGVFTVTLVVTDSLSAQATSITNVTVTTGFALVATGIGMSEGIGKTESVGAYNGGPGLGPESTGTRSENLGSYNGAPGIVTGKQSHL